MGLGAVICFLFSSNNNVVALLLEKFLVVFTEALQPAKEIGYMAIIHKDFFFRSGFSS